MSRDLKRIIEALLFVSETPLSLAQLSQVLEASEKDAVKQALEELVAEYQQSDKAFEIVPVAGGYLFRTRPDMAFWLRKLKKEQVTRLSKAALETLAVVAYRQPVLKAEIERIRGVEVGGILRTLMEKNLVRVAGRQDLPGRPLIYSTTRRFLEVFDLQDLKDLPTVEELEKLAGIAQETPADQDDELPLGRPPAPTLDDLIPVEGGLPPLVEAEDGEDEWEPAAEEDQEPPAPSQDDQPSELELTALEDELPPEAEEPAPEPPASEPEPPAEDESPKPVKPEPQAN